MPQINCHIPIKLCITGRLSDAQLDELGDTVVRAVVARIAFAERTIGRSGGRKDDRIFSEDAHWEQGRYDSAEGSYSVMSYQGPPRKTAVKVQPASKRPHELRIFIKDHRLTVTLNGKVVASGWIDDNVGVAIEENYNDDPARYYVTLWIDGLHEVQHDAGAISAFREVAEDINFYIRRTSGSLQENPLPRTRQRPPAKPAPPKKSLPKIIVLPQQAQEDPYAPFLESDPNPPDAYFTPNVKKLREGMARGDSDVEQMAIDLTLPELRSLRHDERTHLLRKVAENWFVGDDKERTLNDLLDATPEPDAARLLEELRANNSELLRRLEDVIDGEEYVRFHEALRRLYLRSMTPEELLSRANAAREETLVWADPGFLTFLEMGRVVYKATRNRDGTIHVRRWVATPIPMGEMELAPLDFDPFEMVAVYFKTSEDVLGGSKGSVVYIPASNLLLLENKEFKRDMQLAMNVGMMFGGGAGMLRATGRVALALSTAELAVGAANVAIDNYRSELEKTPQGAAFLRNWELVNLAFTAYSAGTVVRSISRVMLRQFRDLRSAYRAFQTTRAGMDPAIASKIDAEIAPILSQADEIEKAIATEAHGDVSTIVRELGEPPPPETPFVAMPPNPSGKPMPSPKVPTEALPEPKPTVKAPSASPQSEPAPSGREGATGTQQDLDDLRQSARTDPDAAHALVNRYKQMSDFELFRRFADEGDETAAAIIRQRFPSDEAALRKVLGSNYRPPHSATAILRRNGGEVSRQLLQSGSMTAEERALGFPKSTLATHTEARAVKQAGLRPGDKFEIRGQYDPCGSCMRAMQDAATKSGATITYWWPGGSEVFRPIGQSL
jgi:Pput_2613-like deaminase